MYCPKCSQQQVSEQRFCSRCGFPLTDLAALVSADGVLPAAKKRSRRSPRFEGMKQGSILLMLAVVLLPLVDIIAAPYHEALVFMFLLAGIMRAAYALIFQEGAGRSISVSSEHGAHDSATDELSGGHAAALPHARSIPASDLINTGKDTSKVVEHLSVTENTTRLLDEK